MAFLTFSQWSKTLGTSELSVLISCLSNLRNVARTIRFELPAEVIRRNRGGANSGACEPHFKRGVYCQFFTPDEATQSGRCDCGAILPELDSDSINRIRCQLNREVDIISTLLTELCEGFSDVSNGEGCSVQLEVVASNLLVVYYSD